MLSEHKNKDNARNKFNQRILPRDAVPARTTSAALQEETQNRNKLKPLERFPAGETAGPAPEGGYAEAKSEDIEETACNGPEKKEKNNSQKRHCLIIHQ